VIGGLSLLLFVSVSRASRISCSCGNCGQTWEEMVNGSTIWDVWCLSSPLSSSAA
jgi:hypothetical protein